MIGDLGIYFGLFTVAFIAATVLPMHSEAVLTGLLVGNSFCRQFSLKWPASAMCSARSSTGYSGGALTGFVIADGFPPAGPYSIGLRPGINAMAIGHCS
jgi:membrane protein YqaA with SNARE-associated domain